MTRLGHSLPFLTAWFALQAASTSAQTAQVQLIHNCADLAASTVDVYLNGELSQDNMAFRTATPFIEVSAASNLEVGFAPANSSGPGDVIASFEVVLSDGEQYVLVASGIISLGGYSPSPEFSLAVFSPARQSSIAPGTTDVLIYNGSTDAASFGLEETAIPLGGLFGSLSYGEFLDYVNMPANNLTFELLVDGGPTYQFNAPFGSLGVADLGVVLLGSGFVHPAMNSNGPEFGLWMALPGGGELVELQGTVVLPTLVQLINNSGDLAATMVDVYLDGSLVANDLDFRSATSFLEIDPDAPNVIGVAPGNSTDVFDSFELFPLGAVPGRAHVAVINGTVSPTGYEPATPLSLDVRTSARQVSASMAVVDVLFHHGSTDGPTLIDISEETAALGTLVDDLGYGAFSSYVTLDVTDMTFLLRDGSGAEIDTYEAAAETNHWEGLAVTVLASGFEEPAANSGGPRLGLWAAFPEGGDLIELPEPLNVGLHAARPNEGLALWPNPASSEVFLTMGEDAADLRTATVVDPAGRRVTEVPISNLVNEGGRVRIPLGTLSNGAYILRATGGSGTIAVPFQVAR